MNRLLNKRMLLGAAAMLVLLAIGGFLVVAAGFAPIKASSGHWKISRAMLQFAKKRAVATQSLTAELPKLDEPSLVLKGAGHYESGCRPCHGAPGMPQPRVAAAMTPAPPNLVMRVKEYDDKELFFIVKHGIKFTGMPAWPSQKRDDEVRAVVAFLIKYPKLDAEKYRQLVHGEEAPASPVEPLSQLEPARQLPEAVTASCARCHGSDGLGRGSGVFPKLAGQQPEYFIATMQAYALGERHSGIMQPIAAGLNRDERREIAEYYSRLPPGSQPAQRSAGGGRISRGQEIARRGIPKQGVPSCADCHGPVSRPRNPMYPSLAGQYADYLILQLELFKTESRGGSAYAHLMHHVSTRLSREQMRDVATYYSSLP